MSIRERFTMILGFIVAKTTYCTKLIEWRQFNMILFKVEVKSKLGLMIKLNSLEKLFLKFWMPEHGLGYQYIQWSSSLNSTITANAGMNFKFLASIEKRWESW